MSEYRMPKLGADMEDAILVEWKVKEGDYVQKGDIIAEIETVKGDIDVEVFEDGIIEKIVAQPGERLPVGTVLAYIKGEAMSDPPDKEPKEIPPIEEPTPSPMPEEVPPQKEPAPLQPPPEEVPPLEEPPTIIPSPEVPHKEKPPIPTIPEETPSPVPHEITPPHEEPTTPEIPKEIPGQPTPAPDRTLPSTPSPNRPTFRHSASPLARRMAAEMGIDLAKVKGTGEGGIIHKVDIERHAASKKNGSSLTTIQQSAPIKVAPTKKSSARQSQKMRQAIAAAMSKSNKEIPHYYLETDIDMQAAQKWLEENNPSRPVERILMPVLLLKAVALALKKVPDLNSYWLENQLQQQEGIHIGFAISLRKGGLVIPAIHDVDTKNLKDLMLELTDVSDRARTGKLRSSELTDGTITITSMGDRGVEKVFGVIYPPQVAIIGFGKIRELPWAVENMIGVRPILTVTIAADHRATDGRTGAKFLSTLKQLLQQPEKLA